MNTSVEHKIQHQEILRMLTEIVGAGACKVEAAEILPFVTDYRRLYHGSAIAVVLPSTTEQVSRVMATCHAHGIPVVPQGGNTSLMGGSVPAAAAEAVVLSLSRMNQVLEVDTANDTLTVGAGVTLWEARNAAADKDRLFPLRIGSEGSCQIGGNIATNAGGTAVLRYGNMRDLVLGIEAVLPDGSIYSGLRGLRKDNTGYDLKQLFIGSEGTLGIVTAAVLKLYPVPKSSCVAFVAVDNPTAAVELLGVVRKTAGQDVTAFELISGPALDLVCAYLGGARPPLLGQYPWMVLLELTSALDEQTLIKCMEEVLESGLARGLLQDAAVASSLADAQTFWKLREEISDAQTRTGGSIKCDISVPLSHIGEFIDRASREVLALVPDARMVVYGHMGDGNVHFNPLRPDGMAAPEFLNNYYAAISRLVDGLAHEFGGSISAEHGIGVAKRDDLSLYKSRTEIDLMQKLKQALDPANILNPGKLLPRQPLLNDN